MRPGQQAQDVLCGSTCGITRERDVRWHDDLLRHGKMRENMIGIIHKPERSTWCHISQRALVLLKNQHQKLKESHFVRRKQIWHMALPLNEVAFSRYFPCLVNLLFWQPARENGAQKPQHGSEVTERQTTLNRPRKIGETNLSPQAPTCSRTHRRRQSWSKPVADASMPPPAAVEVCRRPLPRVFLSHGRQGRFQQRDATEAKFRCNRTTGQPAYQRPAYLTNAQQRPRGSPSYAVTGHSEGSCW